MLRCIAPMQNPDCSSRIVDPAGCITILYWCHSVQHEALALSYRDHNTPALVRNELSLTRVLIAEIEYSIASVGVYPDKVNVSQDFKDGDGKNFLKIHFLGEVPDSRISQLYHR